jgi:hypothetical protein
MRVDHDVIRDLLPLYLAGEASSATRRLVEEHLAASPELARLAQAANDSGFGDEVTVSSPPTAQKAAFDTTRALLRRRAWLTGGAIFATLLPLTSSGSEQGLRFLLLRDAPAVAVASLVAAGLLWIALWRTSRRLRVTGL